MIINALKIENNDAVQQIEKECDSRVNEVKSEKQALLDTIREMNGQLKLVENEKHTEQLKREELEEELQWRGRGHESEVETRLRFESRLNHLYAVKRELESELSVATKKLKARTNKLDVAVRDLKKANEDIDERKNEKDLMGLRIDRQQSLISHYELQLDYQEKRINEQTEEINHLKSEVAEIADERKITTDLTINQQVKISKLQSKKNQAKNEVTLTKQNLIESQREKENAYERVDKLKNEYDATVKKYKFMEQEFASIHEKLVFSKRRVKALEEADKIRPMFLKLKQKYKVKKSHIADLKENVNSIQAVHQAALEKLDSALKAMRQQAEQVEEQQMQIKDLKEEIEEKQRTTIKTKKENAELNMGISKFQQDLAMSSKLLQSNKEINDGQVKAIHKQMDRMKEVLYDEAQVKLEWKTKFEEEQARSVTLNSEIGYLKIASKEYLSKIDILEQKLDEKNRLSNLERAQNNEMNTTMIIKEKMADELKRKIAQLETTIRINSQGFDKRVQNINKHHKGQLDKKDFAVNQISLLIEDHRSHLHRLSDAYLEKVEALGKAQTMQKNVEDTLQQELQANEATVIQNAKQKEEIKQLQEEIETLNASMHQSTIENQAKMEEIEKLQANLTVILAKIPKNLRNLDNPVQRLETELLQVKSQLKVYEDARAEARPKGVQTKLKTTTVEVQTEPVFERTMGRTYSKVPMSRERSQDSTPMSANNAATTNQTRAFRFTHRRGIHQSKTSRMGDASDGSLPRLDNSPKRQRELDLAELEKISPDTKLLRRAKLSQQGVVNMADQMRSPRQQAFYSPQPPKRMAAHNVASTGVKVAKPGDLLKHKRNTQYSDKTQSAATLLNLQDRKNSTTPHGASYAAIEKPKRQKLDIGIKAHLKQANSRNKDDFAFIQSNILNWQILQEYLKMATTLLAHEAFRVQVLLRDEIKKLSFLASVSQILKGKQSNVSEVSELMGDEISRIIAEQRKLEHKYAELVAQRATLTGIHNKAKHTAVAEEIQEVAIGLRENTKNLTRVLKDNPNIQGNLSKIQNDRNQFINYIDGFINDLHNLNTESFNNIILTEVERQNSLSKKRQKEKETALHAKQLQADCVLEKEEYQKEEKEALAQIQNLKESLLEAKTDQSIRLSYEEADFGAAEEKEQRENKTAEKQLEDKIKDLHRRKRLELKVHQKINDFIDLKKQKILTENTEWMNRENEDFTDEDQKLQNLQDKRTAVKARLNALEESVTREELRQKEREEEEQRMSEIMRLKAIENERKALALKVILAEYMEFREKFATMKKKKGRRGGKKGKKGKKK